MANHNSTIQALRKDCKAFGYKELCYDVYQDSVVFLFYNRYGMYQNFFESVRGVMLYEERGGFSIDRRDAVALGIPMDKSGYIIDCRDLRKKGY